MISNQRCQRTYKPMGRLNRDDPMNVLLHVFATHADYRLTIDLEDRYLSFDSAPSWNAVWVYEYRNVARMNFHQQFSIWTQIYPIPFYI